MKLLQTLHYWISLQYPSIRQNFMMLRTAPEYFEPGWFVFDTIQRICSILLSVMQEAFPTRPNRLEKFWYSCNGYSYKGYTTGRWSSSVPSIVERERRAWWTPKREEYMYVETDLLEAERLLSAFLSHHDFQMLADQWQEQAINRTKR